MSKKKKLGLIIGSLALVASVSAAVGITLAFFTDEETAVNKFTMGNIDVSLDEPNWTPEDFDPDNPQDKYEEQYPGDSVYKDPTVTATEGNSYMRLKVEILDKSGAALTGTDDVTVEQQVEKILKTVYYDTSYNADGNPVTSNILKDTKYSEAALAQKVTEGTVKNLYNDESFSLDSSRSTTTVLYFNYIDDDNIFSTDDADKAVLFTNIVIPSNWDKPDVAVIDPTGKGYQFKITVQAIQTEGFANADEAFTALDEQLATND